MELNKCTFFLLLQAEMVVRVREAPPFHGKALATAFLTAVSGSGFWNASILEDSDNDTNFSQVAVPQHAFPSSKHMRDTR